MIYVIDSIMGSGKTSWSIDFMNNLPTDKRIMYITPFLTEINRIISSTNKNMVQPISTGDGKKDNLYEKILNHQNIASTHALFKTFDDDLIYKIEGSNYILILDEVMDAVVPIMDYTSKDIEILLSSNMIRIDNHNKVYWIDNSATKSKYDNLKIIANNDLLYCVNNKAFIWQYPPYLFDLYEDIYIMTYLFDCSILKYYFDLNDIKYTKRSIKQIDGKYTLVDYYEPDTKSFRKLINIYFGKMNINYMSKNVLSDSRRLNATLSKTWFTRKTNEESIKQLKNNVYNYYYHINAETPATNRLWSCFNDELEELRSKVATIKNFLSFNSRAINDRANTSCLAYIVNIYPHQTTNQYFKSNGIKMDSDSYALSFLLQWIWRSRIRNGKPIDLYLPSHRMRKVLLKWLGYSAKEIKEFEKKNFE